MKEYEKATAYCRICKKESPEYNSKDKANEWADKHEKETKHEWIELWVM
jgi:hypothetical protein